MSEGRSVQSRQKIRLRLQAGSTAEVMDIRLPDPELTFIFGIGSAGLTPFECLLNQRTETDAIAFRVAGSDACLFFGWAGTRSSC